MYSKFMGRAITGMREYAGLSVDELADAIGIGKRTVQRLEASHSKTVIKHEVFEKIVKATQMTKPIFAQILATAAGPDLGVRFIVKSADSVEPSFDATRVFRLFADYGYQLSEQERQRVEILLADLRCLTAQADRTAKVIADDVTQRINDARAKPKYEIED